MTPILALAALAHVYANLPSTVTATPFPGLEEPRTIGCLTQLSGLTLEGDHGFGGFSDLAVDPEAGTMVLVSDAGQRRDVELVLDGDGVIRGVGASARHAMVDDAGVPLGKKSGGDAEGLAFLGRDHLVSFEGRDRLAVLRGDGTLGTALAFPEADEPVIGLNSGYEAITFLRDGRVLAISEGKGPDGRALLRQGRLVGPISDWTLSAYQPAEDFAVTSAGTDPATGDVFVLERAFSIWRGPRARIVRVASDALDALDDPVVRGRELARMGFLEGTDNMEGLDVHRAEDGALRLYLVSDDNFNVAQRTVVMTLGENPACAPR